MTLSTLIVYVLWGLLLTSCSSSSLAKKRKRFLDLVDDYSATDLLECTQAKDTPCEVCHSGVLAEYCVSSPTNDNEKVSACKSCLTKMKVPEMGERVLVLSPENTLEVGKIRGKTQKGTYLVEFFEKRKVIHFPRPMIKLAHEIIPNEKLCQMCNYFIFGDQKCARNNCGQIICHSCFDQVSRCEYCRLLHVGTPIQIRKQNVTKQIKEILQRRWGKNFGILYAFIRGILFSEDQNGGVEYYVEISNDYFWITDEENGKMSFTLKNKSIPAILLENEVEIFKRIDYEEFFS